MGGGGNTTSVPTSNNSHTTVDLPPWMNEAGQQATEIASGISTRPYQPYTNPLVAPMTPNTSTAISRAGDTSVGTGAINLAGGSAYNATTMAGRDEDTGQGAINSASELFNHGGTVAHDYAGAGQGWMGALQNLGQTGGAYALNTQGAGGGNVGAMTGLAGRAGSLASSSAGSGQSDLSSARGYSTASANPINSGDISRLMNPYVSQALDPAAEQIRHQSAMNNVDIGNAAAMRGSFGGSRQGVLEGENERNQMLALGNLYKTGYSDAYDKASSMASDEKSRNAGAAGLFQQTGGLSGALSNDDVQRLISAGGLHGQAGGLESGLASDSLARLNSQSANDRATAGTESGLATDSLQRLLSAGSGQQGLSGAQSGLATADVDRVLSTVSPSLATAQSQVSQYQTSLQNLVSSGQLEQTQAQNMLDSAYGQYLEERDWVATQLNALISTLSGVPYGTSTTSRAHGTQAVGSSDSTGSMLGGIAAIAGLFL